jgi:cell division initiation protein
MKISPLSIKKQEFKRKVKGYDPEEVQAFLEKLADDIDELQQENENIKRQLEDANLRLSEFSRIEKNLQDTLLKAQESSSKAIESTKKQASLIIKEAEIKASQIEEKAKNSAKAIRDSVIALREEKDLIIAKLKAIINSQARLLDMKVADAGEDAVVAKEIENPNKLDLDINRIVDKLE